MKNKKILFIGMVLSITCAILLFTKNSGENKLEEQKLKQSSQQQIDKLVERAIYKVDESAIYNGLLLENSKANPKRWNTYLYFPNQEQLLDNIPQCVEPAKAEAELYLKSYQKVFRYLLEHHILSKSQTPIVIGGFAKKIVDFNYNYQTFPYFKKLYDTEILRVFFNAENSINENTTGMLGVYYKDKYADSPWHVNSATYKQVVDAVFTPEEQKELAKAQDRLLKQVAENCVQAGYGTDFYSIWWAGLANQGVLGITTQSDMMYELFFDAYYIYNGIKTVQERQKLGMTGQIWDIFTKNNDFIKRVIVANPDDNKTSRLIFNTLTAEILQEDFKNENYSLPLRVGLFAKLAEAKYQNKLASYENENDYIYNYLQKSIENQDSIKVEKLLGYELFLNLQNNSDESYFKQIIDECNSLDLNYVNHNKKLNSFSEDTLTGVVTAGKIYDFCNIKGNYTRKRYESLNKFYTN